MCDECLETLEYKQPPKRKATLIIADKCQSVTAELMPEDKKELGTTIEQLQSHLQHSDKSSVSWKQLHNAILQLNEKVNFNTSEVGNLKGSIGL